MRYVLINDFFKEDLGGGGHSGGAALNDEIIYDIFKFHSEDIIKVKSSSLTESFLEARKDSFFIISNFFHIDSKLIEKIQELNYVVYAHDYKFVAHTNPALYKDFLVPKEEIIFEDFFNKSRMIICQSGLQQRIYNDNLQNANTLNFSGNLWDTESLDLMSKLKNTEKKRVCSVIKSHYPQKGVPEAIKFCIQKQFDYELIWSPSHHKFLEKMAQNKALAFYPLTPETCGRMGLEAKMMGIKVFTTELLGASHEPWFDKNEEDLISLMRSKHEEIYFTLKGIGG